MTRIVIGVVVTGLVMAVALGLEYGFDTAAVSMLFALVVLGALAIAVARGKERGLTAPARCGSCGGLLSPNAPYCKHCGQPQSPRAGTPGS